MRWAMLRLVVFLAISGWLTGCGDNSSGPSDSSAPRDASGEIKPKPAPADPVDPAPAEPGPSVTPARTDKPDATPATAPAVTGPPRVALDTTMGTIVLELDEEKAPITVKNFLRYVDDGFYTGTIFHRVMSNFMIQGGGFTAVNSRKAEGLHPAIRNESEGGLSNARGTIAMGLSPGKPHSATSQFYINVVDNDFLNHPTPAGWGYCAFGKVVEGMDVVDKIRAVKTKADARGEMSVPLDPPVLEKARRVTTAP